MRRNYFLLSAKFFSKKLLAFLVILSLFTAAFSQGNRESKDSDKDNTESKDSSQVYTAQPRTTPQPSKDSQAKTTTTPTTPAPAGKTWSTYTDGIRYINFGEKTNDPDAIFVSTIQPLPKPDYSAIDNAVANLYIPTSMSVAEAAKLIVRTSGATTIKEKTRAIFTWVCLNVDYDYSSTKPYTSIRADGVFSTRLGICDGYSDLVKEMCLAVGINCIEAVGIVVTGTDGSQLYPLPHAWNVITIDNDYDTAFVLDSTWASQGSFDTGKYLDDKWFDPDPCFFVTSHWSSEALSLVSPFISRDDFLNLPVLDPSLEKYGIDGKELLEFCYAHSITSVISPIITTSSIYRMPISKTLLCGKEYEIAYDSFGTYTQKKFSTNNTDGPDIYTLNLDIGYIPYNLSDSITASVNQHGNYLEPHFIYYDDTAEFVLGNDDEGLLVGNGKWKVDLPSWTNKPDFDLHFFPADGDRWDVCAIYDPIFQEWGFAMGGFSYGSYFTRMYSASKDFDVDLSDILDEITVKIDPSIPLDREGSWKDADYNDVYVPLSKKDEVVSSVLNYDWRQDKDFADFVYWMQRHNIPQEQIDFYIEMARYPIQRGKVVPFQNTYNIRFGGADFGSYPWCKQLYDEQGNKIYAGGMQLFFESRKQETRHLLRNDKIPILLVHIIDSDSSGTTAPANYFTIEKENAKKKLESVWTDKSFEFDFAEITLSYKDYESIVCENNVEQWQTVDGYGSWATSQWGTDIVLSEIAKKNPKLAAKYSDNTKTAVIKYFDTLEMNCYYSAMNIDMDIHPDFWHYMRALGYGRNSHDDLFGTLQKYEAPSCFDMECVREDAICPLCLYSFDID